MATIITHGVAAFAISTIFSRQKITPSIATCGIIMSMLPDADVLGFSLGIPYEHPLGHRGFTHSILFAVFSASIVTAIFSKRRSLSPDQHLHCFLFLFFSVVSHGILDAVTTGGLGVGFFIPFSNERYFFAFRPVLVSPIGIEKFFSSRGLAVLYSEFLWIWLPCMTIMAGKLLYQRR